jgi:hypothetical protein
LDAGELIGFGVVCKPHHSSVSFDPFFVIASQMP